MHKINLVYNQNIDENPCSHRYVDGNISNTLQLHMDMILLS